VLTVTCASTLRYLISSGRAEELWTITVCYTALPMNFSPQSYCQNRRVFIPVTFLCEPMGRWEIFHTTTLLVEIEGHFTHEFVTYVYETDLWWKKMLEMQNLGEILQTFIYNLCQTAFGKFSLKFFAKFREIVVTKFHERNINFVFREIKKIDFRIHPS
jgi:hypothetical protein